MMEDISLLFKKSILGFVSLFIFTACSYNDTAIEVGSLFDPTFDFSKSSELTFDENNVEVKNGKVQLKPLDLKHEGDDFNNGSHVGTHVFNTKISLSAQPTVDSNHVNNIIPSKSSSLVGYWRFDGDFNDSTANGLNAIPSGDVSTSGEAKLGSFSGNFDGALDYAQVGTATILQSPKVTFSMWTKLNSTVPSIQLFGGYGNTGSAGYWLGYEVGKYEFRASDGVTGGSAAGATSTSDIIDGEWVHLVGTFEAGSLKIYVNGVLEQVNSGVAGNIDYTGVSAGFVLGNIQNFSPTRYFNGQMDEVAVWSDVLAEDEVFSLYSAQNANFTELSSAWTPKWNNIVGYWKMDGNWQDSSGKGNHGTPNNTLSWSTFSRVGGQGAEQLTNTDHLDVGTSPFFENSATEMTLMGWFYIDPADFDGTTAYIADTAEGSPTANNGFSILFDDRGAALPEESIFFSIKGAGSLERVFGVNNAISKPDWYHLAFTYSNGDAKIYKNGRDITVLAVDGNGAFVPRNQNLHIGAQASGFGSRPGFFDDISIFDIGLTIEEIKRIYERQKQKYAGYYDSEVIDLGSATSNWPDLSWSTSLPFGKELVGDFDNDGTPDSESSSDYSSLNGDLSIGLIGYWKFNETLTGTVPGGFDIRDFSLLGAHGTIVGPAGIVLGERGVLDNSMEIITSGSMVSIPDQPEYDMTTNFTLAAWVKTNSTVLSQLIRFGLSATNGYILAVNGAQIDLVTNDGSYNHNNFPATGVNDGSWRQVVVSLSGVTASYFLDGRYLGSQIVPAPAAGSSSRSISTNGGFPFLGKVDEVAIWSRVLTNNEIQLLYRRGANRIKFQVKSCVDSSCECKSLNASPVGSATDCDGDTILNALDFDDTYKAEFIGPGGDGTTYYSELFNRRGTDLSFNCGLNTSDSNSNVCVNDEITLGAGPRPTGPVIDYSDFPLAARPDANPYFQYRVYMEADENTACDGSPCLPELTSVNLNPDGTDKFYGGLQEVAANKPISYSAINSLTVTADDCATFQLSPNGSDFYYWSTSSWVLATVPSHRSSKGDLETNIVSFSTQFGSGLLYIKSFLETNASQTQNCSVQSIDLNYSRR